MDRAAPRPRSSTYVALAVVLAAGLAALVLRRLPADASAAAPRVASARPVTSKREPIDPVPLPAAQDPRKVALGARLFRDPRLSVDHTVSCASCHHLDAGGDDGRSTSIGARGAHTALNTPTIFNIALNPKQHWDGRAELLEDQLAEPMASPRIMATTWDAVASELGKDPGYTRAFTRAFGGPVTTARLKDALATYERTLVLTGSRFDRYLAGEKDAVSEHELAGYELFKSYGCASCHQGRNVGGNVFEVLGIVGDYFAARGTPIVPADLGRFNVTKHAEDRHRFRVPSLRAAVLTAPYLHDGTAVTLEDAILAMGRFQLGADIPPEDVAQIAAFLGTLVGVYSPAPIDETP